MRGGWIAIVVLAAACGPSGPAGPTPSRWTPLAQWENIAISYDPASASRLPEGVVEVCIRLDYPAPLEFQGTSFDAHEMRVQVQCGTGRVNSTDYVLRSSEREVRAGTRTPSWSTVPREGRAESAWFPALCRMVDPETRVPPPAR